ncbi:MAG: TauD/TfdA family dioxygenase [Alphaproteobacteria bacterium]|nr:TauD/TfdA family dioxygenase [Alphaproteobacteria bacterium]
MSEMLLEPVRDPSAWKSADFENNDTWIHRFTEQDLAEIDSALKAVRQRGLAVPDFGRDEFPLPALQEKIDRVIKEIENGRGFALFRGLPVDKYDLDTLRVIYWGIGAYFGDPISQNSKGQILADVVDLGNDYSDINGRGYKTNAELLPHVDSSDLVALMCVKTARSGGESMLSSSMSVYNEILEHHREFLPVLYRGFKRDLRGEGVTEELDELTFHEIPIFSYFGGQLSCNFNDKIIRSAHIKMGKPLTEQEEAALHCVMTLARRPDICFRMHLQKGDIQLVNNYTVLHSRAAYTDYTDEERKRRLMRFWVNSRNARALEPNFANKYNTGPRGGVAVGDGAHYNF